MSWYKKANTIPHDRGQNIIERFPNGKHWLTEARKNNFAIGVEEENGSITIYDRNGESFDSASSWETALESVKGVAPIGGRKSMRGLLRVSNEKAFTLPSPEDMSQFLENVDNANYERLSNILLNNPGMWEYLEDYEKTPRLTQFYSNLTIKETNNGLV